MVALIFNFLFWALVGIIALIMLMSGLIGFVICLVAISEYAKTTSPHTGDKIDLYRDERNMAWRWLFISVLTFGGGVAIKLVFFSA